MPSGMRDAEPPGAGRTAGAQRWGRKPSGPAARMAVELGARHDRVVRGLRAFPRQRCERHAFGCRRRCPVPRHPDDLHAACEHGTRGHGFGERGAGVEAVRVAFRAERSERRRARKIQAQHERCRALPRIHVGPYRRSKHHVREEEDRRWRHRALRIGAMRAGGEVERHAPGIVAPAFQAEEQPGEVVAGNAVAAERDEGAVTDIVCVGGGHVYILSKIRGPILATLGRRQMPAYNADALLRVSRATRACRRSCAVAVESRSECPALRNSPPRTSHTVSPAPSGHPLRGR
jgi:hypothetical protein